VSNFLPLGISVAASLLAAWVLAGFKLKQLYLVVPRLFAFSALTDKGTIIELQVFNRGRSSEEDVHIDLPPNISYELIAADLSNASIDGFAVVLPRIPPLSEASVIVLAETKIEPSASNIKISSRTTKGIVFKRVDEVLPNAGRFIAACLGAIALAGLMFSLPTLYTQYQLWRNNDQITALTKSGWSGLERYLGSDLKDNYRHGEFPFHFVSASADGKNLVLVFDIVNKTAMLAKITAYFQCPHGKKNALSCDGELKTKVSTINQPLDPLQSARLTVSADLSQLSNISEVFVEVSMQVDPDGRGELVWANFHPLKNEESLAILKLLKQAPQ
jgi:hypothetical protein